LIQNIIYVPVDIENDFNYKSLFSSDFNDGLFRRFWMSLL